MDKLGLLITLSKYIVFLSGKGVSIESGLKEVMPKEGEILPQEILTESYFKAHTEEFYDFYKENILCVDLLPNEAHIKLKEMEDKGKLKAIITSNTDSLHEKAGSLNVLALHGSIHKNFCIDCHKEYDGEYIKKSVGVPRCSCGGIIKPGIVLYDEALNEETVKEAIDHISKADLLIVAGCSLMSYPSSSLLRYFHGRYLALINEEETTVDRLANFVSHEKVCDVMKRLDINTEK